MSVEEKRKCGWRQLDGLYLVGKGLAVICDRLPMPLPDCCPTCNSGLKHTRVPRKINALKLWGEHGYCTEEAPLRDNCYVCHPADAVAYVMGVGNEYPTPKDFVDEAITLGVSKRIPAVPRDIELGKTVVFLTHKKALLCQEKDEKGNDKYQAGVIYAFIVQRIEQIVRESELEEKREALEKRHITPVPVPDNDPDHVPAAKRRGVAKPPTDSHNTGDDLPRLEPQAGALQSEEPQAPSSV